MQRPSVLRVVARRAAAGICGLAVCSSARAAPLILTAGGPVFRGATNSYATLQSVRFYSGGGHEEQPTRSGQYLLDKNDVLTRVLEVVKNFEKVDASKVTPESHFVNDLGLNSLDVVEVVFAIEQEFILDIPDHDAEKIQSITDAVEYISQNPMAK